MVGCELLERIRASRYGTESDVTCPFIETCVVYQSPRHCDWAISLDIVDNLKKRPIQSDNVGVKDRSESDIN